MAGHFSFFRRWETPCLRSRSTSPTPICWPSPTPTSSPFSCTASTSLTSKLKMALWRGPPWPVDLRWADWDAKGELAVVHNVEGHSRLEYPVGHVIYESRGWISHVRFSRHA